MLDLKLYLTYVILKSNLNAMYTKPKLNAMLYLNLNLMLCYT